MLFLITSSDQKAFADCYIQTDNYTKVKLQKTGIEMVLVYFIMLIIYKLGIGLTITRKEHIIYAAEKWMRAG